MWLDQATSAATAAIGGVVNGTGSTLDVTGATVGVGKVLAGTSSVDPVSSLPQQQELAAIRRAPSLSLQWPWAAVW